MLENWNENRKWKRFSAVQSVFIERKTELKILVSNPLSELESCKNNQDLFWEDHHTVRWYLLPFRGAQKRLAGADEEKNKDTV